MQEMGDEQPLTTINQGIFGQHRAPFVHVSFPGLQKAGVKFP